MSLANFMSTSETDLLRIVCGILFVPHALISAGYFFPRAFSRFHVPDAIEVFVKAGFKPPEFWLASAGVIEIVLAGLLIFGIYTPYSASTAAAYLGIISVVVFHVSGHRWFWNTGGCEYPAFWAFCCLLVAIQS
jgi:uncharacterized membrane protein YphA (DoxX/SURF4 family)